MSALATQPTHRRTNGVLGADIQLDPATPPQPVPDQPAGGPYGYDWVGNRLNPPTGTNHMVYNAADQLTAWPGMHQYTYYPDGSLHEEKNADGSQTMKSYTYTADGLMASAFFDGKTLANTWDGDQNRVRFSLDSINHTFVYDHEAGIPAVVTEDGVYYVREPGGELLARVDGSNMSYYHFDQLGSTRLLTDASGSVTDKYDYDAYGAVIAHEKLAGTVDQPYQYVGQSGYYTCWQEPELGLLQLKLRFLDATTGEFTQQDPAPFGLNAYGYVENQPLTMVDPYGLQSTWPSILSGCFEAFGYNTSKRTKGRTISRLGKWQFSNAWEVDGDDGRPGIGIPFLVNITCWWEKWRYYSRTDTIRNYHNGYNICIDSCGNGSAYWSHDLINTKTETKKWKEKADMKSMPAQAQNAYGVPDAEAACKRTGPPSD